MTIPSAGPPPVNTSSAAASSSSTASDERRCFPPKPCHRPKIKRLKAVAQLSHPTSPVTAAAVTKTKRLRKPEHEEAPMITRPCSECGKRFPSWRALFGHMRCHPDRPWRGMEPPSDYPHRGPEFAAPPADQAPASDDASDEEVEVAACLILLKGELGDCSGGDELPLPSDASRYSRCDKVFGASPGVGRDRAGNAKPTSGAATRKCKAEEGDRRATQLHRCNICSMGFSSGQALGGHMSSHWKKAEHRQQVAAAAEGASSSTSETVCRFDLNQPATEETDGFFPSAFGIFSNLKLPAAGFVP